MSHHEAQHIWVERNKDKKDDAGEVLSLFPVFLFVGNTTSFSWVKECEQHIHSLQYTYMVVS